MRLTNTLSGQIEELRPLRAGHVGLYVCGVTPYAESHIGHAMSAIVYDVLVRYLRWRGNPAGGYDVTYVSNYTDVDDKIIDRARELGVDPRALADQNIAQWEDEQRALHLTPPDVRPRVSGEIDGPSGIVALIERIIARGHAYPTPGGDVYFRVRSHPGYGRLSHRNIEQLRAGTRFEPGEQKEFALDFALWKAAKAEEPASVRWRSPWGEGRPGWHIECSAMAGRYLGDAQGAFDIHGGGLDLVFPHHENEIAQSEAAGDDFARLWLHNGLVQRDGEKMSKSIGNVISVREALARWSPDALRLFALSSHYRSPNNLTDDAMAAAAARAEYLASTLSRKVEPAPGGQTGAAQVSQQRGTFVVAMEDDLSTPRAIAVLSEIAREINRFANTGNPIVSLQALLRELACDVLGLSLPTPEERVAHASEERLKNAINRLRSFVAETPALPFIEAFSGITFDKIPPYNSDLRIRPLPGGTPLKYLESEQSADLYLRLDAIVRAILDVRQRERANRNFELADTIREGLMQAGIYVEDTPNGAQWALSH